MANKPRLKASTQVMQALQRFRANIGLPIKALLGNGQGQVNYPSRGVAGDFSHYGKVYIRILNGGTDTNGQTQAGRTTWAWGIGSSIPMFDNYPVLVTRNRQGEYTLSSVDPEGSSRAGVNTLEFNALDPRHKMLYLRNIMNGQAVPISDPDNQRTAVTVIDYLLIANGTVRNIGLDVADAIELASAIPATTGKERLVLIYYASDTDSVGYVQGTVRDISGDVWTDADLTELIGLLDLNTDVPLYTYRLYQGQFAVTEADKRHDLRQFINAPASISSSNPSLYAQYATKSANYTITSADGTIGVNASSGAITITLPSAVGLSGRSFNIKALDVSGGNVTIATTSSQTIDGSLTQVLNTQYDSISVLSDNANWLII